MVESYIICIAFVVYGILVALFLYFCIKCEPSKPSGPIRLPYVVSKSQNKISDSKENSLSKSSPSVAGLSYIVNMESVTPPPSSPDRIWTISSNSDLNLLSKINEY